MTTTGKINAFLTSQKHMTVATASKQGKVEAAYVGFVHKSDFTLMFGTYNISRKYHNLIDNPEVAIVFGSDEGLTVQYEGTALPLAGSKLDEYKTIYFTKHPTARKYEHDVPQVYFKITPHWLRWVDTTQEVEEIEELHF